MDYFHYRENELYCEDVLVTEIAAQTGTPVYIYSAASFCHHYQALCDAFAEIDPLICYSVKGCSNIHILRLMAELGSGFDIVSGGELYRVQQAGGDPSKAVYAGVGKTDDELVQALQAGIGYFNVESEAELENLIRLAQQTGATARASLRVNPNVDPKTHRHTTTGKKETKFGVDLERAVAVFKQFGHAAAVRLTGIHLHLGSPLYTTEPYVRAINKALAFIDQLRGTGFEIDTLNIGGGFGADYQAGQTPPFLDYAHAIIPLVKNQGLRIVLEPGRSISGNSGILVTKTLYRKKGGERDFVIIDAGMNDLIRPTLYDAFHFIWPVRVADGMAVEHRATEVDLPGLEKVDVVGPICETGDFFARERMLPPVQRGDLLAVFTAGAYAFAMSSNYNSHGRAAEVLVQGDTFRTIRRRETYADLIGPEHEA